MDPCQHVARVVQLPRHATHHTSQYSLSSFIKITILIVSCNFCVVQSCGDTAAYATDFAPPTPAPLLACAYHKKYLIKLKQTIFKFSSQDLVYTGLCLTL